MFSNTANKLSVKECQFSEMANCLCNLGLRMYLVSISMKRAADRCQKVVLLIRANQTFGINNHYENKYKQYSGHLLLFPDAFLRERKKEKQILNSCFILQFCKYH